MKKTVKKSAARPAVKRSPMKKGTKLKKYRGDDFSQVGRAKPSMVATDEEKKNYETQGRREAVNRMGQMERDRQEGKTYPYKISDVQPRLKKGGSAKVKSMMKLKRSKNK